MSKIFQIAIFFSLHFALGQMRHELTVFFETDQTFLVKKEKEKIDSILNKLDINNIYEISIIGFCDDRADSDYNTTLSKKRAENVLAFFNGYLKNKKINYSSHGKGEIPLDSLNAVSRQRKLNRRVDISIQIVPNSNINKILFSDIGEKIILQNVLFEANRHVFTQTSYASLDSLTYFLKENENIHFTILGHICCRKKGSQDAIDDDTGKRGLSENRAKAVYDYFSKRGISKDRMNYKGMKADFPLGQGDEMDRRVELKIEKK